MIEIKPPTHCPSCNSALEWVNDQLYCKSDSCGATSQKRVEHFAKTLKIKGLGPAAIEKLELESITEIYSMPIEYIIAKLGSAKLGTKLFGEINQSKAASANELLPAFGISLVGKSATDKLSKVCSSIFDIDEFRCAKAKLGDKVTSNLLTWLAEEFDKYVDLPFSFDFEEVRVEDKKGIVCITGKLTSFKTKAEATKVLENAGYIVVGSVTKDVTILINESGRETDKTMKARNSGILIIEQIGELLNNDSSSLE